MLLLLLTTISVQVAGQSDVSLLRCSDCEKIKPGLPQETLVGKVASIRTYQHTRYEHYLSSFEKDHEIWDKFDDNQKDTIVDIDTELMPISEVRHDL